MREILFRAKTTATNVWTYGHFAKQFDVAQIYSDNGHECVHENTLGQFTGLTDKDGVKIFEGDIVKSSNITSESIAVVVFGCFKPMFFYECAEKVGYTIKNNVYGFYLKSIGGEEMMFSDFTGNSVVIGNIYDNPELIGGDTNA